MYKHGCKFACSQPVFLSDSDIHEHKYHVLYMLLRTHTQAMLPVATRHDTNDKCVLLYPLVIMTCNAILSVVLSQIGTGDAGDTL